MPWSKLVDLELDDEDKLDMAVQCAPGISQQPDYPWGLRITLTSRELKKLDMRADCEVGDLIDMRCFGVVTSVSSTQTNGEPDERVEIQLQKVSVENEADE